MRRHPSQRGHPATPRIRVHSAILAERCQWLRTTLPTHPANLTVVPIRHKPGAWNSMHAVPRRTEFAGNLFRSVRRSPALPPSPHRELARCRVVIATAPLPPRASSLPAVGRSVLAMLPSAFWSGHVSPEGVRQGSAPRPRKLRVLASTWTNRRDPPSLVQDARGSVLRPWPPLRLGGGPFIASLISLERKMLFAFVVHS